MLFKEKLSWPWRLDRLKLVLSDAEKGVFLMLKFSHLGAWVLLAAAATLAGAQNSGSDVYKAKCAMCHGVAGDANTPAGKAFKAPSFSSPDVLKASDADLTAVTKKGKGKMPAWDGKLTEDQIKDVIAYIHTLQKK